VNTAPLRIAILCRSEVFEAWEAECIRQVLALDFVEPVLLIQDASPEPEPRSFFQKFFDRKLFWRIHERRSLKHISAARAVELDEEFRRVPKLKCEPELHGKYTQQFKAGDMARIREHAPDLILRFGFNIIRGEILTVAKYGVWSFHHADEQVFRGGPGGFWEIIHGNIISGAMLQRLTESLDAGILLRKGWFKTIAKSHAANVDQLLWGTTLWMKQVCIDIHNNEAAYLNAKPIQTKAPIKKYPGNFRMLDYFLKSRIAAWKFHFDDLFRAEFWQLGIVPQSISDIMQKGITTDVHWIPQTQAGTYQADPFGINSPERELILCEHYDYKVGKGHIVSITRNGEMADFLKRTHHLSYPYLFEVFNDLMFLPESHENNNVSLRYFDRPEKTDMQLLHGIPAVDSSVVFYEGKWWLFCTREDVGANEALYIYFADNNDSAFEPHAANPVKMDVRSARPAGTPFVHEGKLYRPAQCCVPEYGVAVVIHEIVKLTETSFEEREVRILHPATNWPATTGLHTLSAFGTSETLIDVKRHQFNFDAFKRALNRKLLRVSGR
jgi:hypothetical protein